MKQMGETSLVNGVTTSDNEEDDEYGINARSSLFIKLEGIARPS